MSLDSRPDWVPLSKEENQILDEEQAEVKTAIKVEEESGIAGGYGGRMGGPPPPSMSGRIGIQKCTSLSGISSMTTRKSRMVR